MDEPIYTCPDCGENNMVVSVQTQEFVLGRRKPVTLRATAPVLICQDCGGALADWRMEKARSLAVSAFFKGTAPREDHPEQIAFWHRLASNHRQELRRVGHCGCFYCLKVFEFKQIDNWIDSDQTAMCPLCGIDAVVPATEDLTSEILRQMQQYYFAEAFKV